MMRYQFDETGKYVQWFCVEGTLPGVDAATLYTGDVNPETQYHDTATNKPVDMPPKPSIFHDFDYATKQWVANEVRAWAEIRAMRDRLLGQSDWMVTKAIETGEPMVAGWATYRQALRGITNQPDPLAIVWPQQPDGDNPPTNA